MSNVIFEFKNRARRSVSAPMFYWATLMTVFMVLIEVSTKHRGTYELGAFIATALLGVLLGYRRRVGSVFFAPVIHWFVAWIPLWVAVMAHHGFLRGFFRGLVIITFGWAGIAAAEITLMLVFAVISRSVFSKRTSSNNDVVIFGPNDL